MRRYFPILLSFAVLLLNAGCSVHTAKDPRAENRSPEEEKAYNVMKQGNYIEGVRLFEKIIKKKPANAAAFYYLGYGYGQLGYFETEIINYRKAIALGYQSNGIYRNLGLAYFEQKMIKESIETFGKALSLDPSDADSYFGLGQAYWEKYEIDRAEKEFIKALKLKPDDIMFRERLGILYLEKGLMKKAAKQFRRIIEIEPGNKTARKYLEDIAKKKDNQTNIQRGMGGD